MFTVDTYLIPVIKYLDLWERRMNMAKHFFFFVQNILGPFYSQTDNISYYIQICKPFEIKVQPIRIADNGRTGIYKNVCAPSNIFTRIGNFSTNVTYKVMVKIVSNKIILKFWNVFWFKKKKKMFLKRNKDLKYTITVRFTELYNKTNRTFLT